MVAVTIIYQGDLRCESEHEPSGSRLETDAPTDNQGKGARFSPTDLVGTALGTCMLTVMGIAARTLGVAMEGAKARVEKRMVTSPKRRIGGFDVVITMPQLDDAGVRAKLEQAALQCPVHHSLHPDIQTTIRFDWL